MTSATHVLDTPRLRLRWFSPDDAAFVLELLNEPSWLRFIGDRGVRDLDAARAYIEDGPLAMCRRLGFGLWVVEPRDGGEPMGMCGLIKRDSLEDVDIGFAFLPRFWGRGYAKEAAAATLAHGQRAFGLRRIVAITSQDNERSIVLLRAIGLQVVGARRLPGEDQDALLFAWDAGDAGSWTR